MAVVTYTRAEMLAKAERDAQRMLGCSFAEACVRVDAGKHRGTVIEQVIGQYRWLLS